MIALPKLRPLQRNLDTHYVRLEGVFQVLSREAVTGYLRGVAPDLEGLVFLQDGEPQAAYIEKEGVPSAGLEALAAFLEGLSKPEGYLDIYTADAPLLQALQARLVSKGKDLGQAPASLEDMKRVASDLNLTGALVSRGSKAELELYAQEGRILGAFRPDLDEWSADPRSLPAGLGSWESHSLAEGDSLRNVDLAGQEAWIMGEIRQRMENYVPGFGLRLIDVELSRLKGRGSDAHRLNRAALERLADGLRVRARYLIGRNRANLLYADLKAPLAKVLDLEGR